MFTGSLVALVTPFKDGKLDEEGLRANIDFQIKNGTDGLVVCATTGESPTLTEEEKEIIIKISVEICDGRIPVIASTGTNSTVKTLKATERAKELNASGVLVITPYYNKPTQEGLYQHFKAVTDEVDIPVIVYNVPGRTCVNILPSTVKRIAEFKNIVGIKEASGDLNQVSEIIQLCNDSITVLSGDDSLTLPMLAVGAKGVVSVIANIVPGDLKSMIEAFNRGDFQKARELHNKLFPLTKAMFYETNPIPAKAAMELLGMAAGEPRLPLIKISKANEEKLKKSLTEYGILN